VAREPKRHIKNPMEQRTSNTETQLDSLFARAAAHAEREMRTLGIAHPTFLATTPTGPFFMSPSDLPDDESKDAFIDLIRLMCVAHSATAGVLALETWTLAAKPGQTLDPSVRPSLSPDRRELVVLLGESQLEPHRQQFLPILRDNAGRFAGFGQTEALPPCPAEGRFSKLIPSAPPSRRMRRIARALLRVRGFAGPATPFRNRY
jgi:hypothetical protein